MLRMTMRFFLLFSFFIFSFPVFAVTYPQATGYVNDIAHLYSDPFRQALESDLSQFDQQTGNQIAVVTVEDLQGEPIEDYAVKLFEAWKIGKAKEDTGILLLISKNDRQVRIEVGYGLEPVVTDGRAGEIIRNNIAPHFQKGDYESGTRQAVDALKALIVGDGEATTPPKTGPPAEAPDIPIGPLLFIGYGLFTYLGSFLGRSKAIWPGGAIGAVLGLLIGSYIASWVGSAIGAVLLGMGGLLLDFILSRNYQYRSTHGMPTGFWQSGGGFSSGSRWGGGGGFGGFGGGRSGGGGASGRW